MKHETRELQRLREIAQEYREAGYEVIVEPPPSKRPAFLRDFDIDILAKSPEDNVVVEVKSRRSVRGDQRVADLAAALEGRRHWRFEFVMTNPRAPQPEPVELADAPRGIEQAERLMADGLLEAALLVAWAATEAVLRKMARQRGLQLRTSHVDLVRALRSHGDLSVAHFRALTNAIAVRNRVAHGYRSGVDDLRSVTRPLLRIAWQLMRRETEPHRPEAEGNAAVTVRELVDWFYSQFEDPVHHVPYETAEGGYQYYAGGPYDARDELLDHFPRVAESLIDEAARMIEAEATEWVRKGDYG
jgi:uncharacterized protein YutE (UPF0331/DUF86 family)